MFEKTKIKLKKMITPTMDWKNIIKDSASYGNNIVTEPAVSPDITFEQFKNTYNGVRKVAFIWIIGLTWALFSLSMSTVWFGWGVSILTSLIIFMFYFRTNMELYRAREVMKKWSKRHKPYKLTPAGYFDVIMNSPKEFYPLSVSSFQVTDANGASTEIE